MSNQKGGVGKSTVSVSLATYLHCVMGKNVMILDCDSHQNSLVNMRQRDIAAVEKSDEYKQLIMARYKKTGRRAYPIMEATAENAPETIQDILESNPDYYDMILVDLPGSISSQGVLRTIINMDYVLTPVIADRMAMQSTLTFATAVLDYCKAHKGLPLKEFLLFWNKVDRRASTEVFDAYVKILERLKLHVLDTVIPESRRFDKELSLVGKPWFRNTLLPPPSKLLKGSNIDLLAEELCKLLNI
jgi:cellulose biosynthesis protein BcsQ